MPEIKITFIQSKMNKDLDGRIIPNGQYRDGENIQISRSEGDDVGALETVLGNLFKTDFDFQDENLEAIGIYFDDTNDNIYVFLTNYTDSSFNQLNNPCAGLIGSKCFIVKYNTRSGQSAIMVEGNFLNFSKTHLITGINLLEDLLFWTDDRNQPRKINVKLAIPGYYTTEDQISVAKYYPYTAPLLLRENENCTQNSSAEFAYGTQFVDGKTLRYNNKIPKFSSTMSDTTSQWLPIHAAAKVKRIEPDGRVVLYGEYFNIKGRTLSPPSFNDGNLITSPKIPLDTERYRLEKVNLGAIAQGTPETYIECADIANFLVENDIVYFQFLNPNYNPTWSGDPDYLKKKFARFSYRFKFTDDEYSIIAPFTQAAFIPQQDGYFIGNTVNENFIIEEDDGNIEVPPQLVGDESRTLDSTIVSFMQNKVTQVDLTLLAPTKSNERDTIIPWNKVRDELGVVEVDILLKESDKNNVYIVDTLVAADFVKEDIDGNPVYTDYLYYSYQSKKAWKTIPTDQVTRNSDAAPIRAKAQEVSGNRVIYGNYIDKHTSPARLDYFLNVGQKPNLPECGGVGFDNSDSYIVKEYQNHTLKQNRTYQVGIILSDRYGRQSNVILSDFIISQGGAKNSTVYHKYFSSEKTIITDNQTNPLADANTWPGDALTIIFNNVIPKAKTEDGYPGVYSVADGTIEGVVFDSLSNLPANCISTVVISPVLKTIADEATAVVQLKIGSDGTLENWNFISSSGGWLCGEEFVVNWPKTEDYWLNNDADFCSSAIFGLSITGNAVCNTHNPLGWYSYKVVVKQQQQEYYNIYMPTAMAGYPCDQNVTNEPGNPDSGYGDVPTLIYPKGQDKTTSHLVLFSDNVNKVPRDLTQVGPNQDKFRSDTKLFNRVTTNIVDLNNSILSYASNPTDPNPDGDKVVDLGNMSKLELGNLTFSPGRPIIPNLFYRGKTDPLIARIETKIQFGLDANGSLNDCELDSTDAGNNPPSPFNDCTNAQQAAYEGLNTCPPPKTFNSTYGWGPTLCISETNPVESELEIFWETSTSGLISDLNYKIEFEDNTAPSGITFPDITWSEEQDYNTRISADFQAVGPTGLPLGNSCSIQLTQAKDQTGAIVTPQFRLMDNFNGSYHLVIAPHDPILNNNFLRWEQNDRNIFTFKFLLTRISTGATTEYEFNGEVFNRPPNERNTPTIREIKNAICSRNTGTSRSWMQSSSTQTMSLKAEQGAQKYGVSRFAQDLIDDFDVAQSQLYSSFLSLGLFGQYVVDEDNFPNAAVNYGKIAPTTDKFIFANPMGPYMNGSYDWAQPSKYDSGDVNLMGQMDFGYFGGPTKGNPFQKDGSGFFTFSGNIYYPSKFHKGVENGQKIYAPLESSGKDQYGPNGAGDYPAPFMTGFDKKAPVYLRLGPGTDNFIVNGVAGLVKNTKFPPQTAFSTSVEVESGVIEQWDGRFKAANGSYGSIKPGENPPIGPGTSIEVVWSIPRMYQVSMMVPHGEYFAPSIPINGVNTGANQSSTRSWLNQAMLLPSPVCAFGAQLLRFYGKWMPAVAGQITNPITGYPPCSITALLGGTWVQGGKEFDVQPAGEVIFGVVDPSIYENKSDTDGENSRNAILKYMPSGPVYWHGTNTPEGAEQMDPRAGGEEIVGFKYNQYDDGGSVFGEYPHHYWPDLNYWLRNDSSYQDFRDNPTVDNAPNWMKLQPGANTFYQWNKSFAEWWVGVKKGKDKCFLSWPNWLGGGCIIPSKSGKVGGHWIPAQAQKNILNYMFHLGGLSGGRGPVNSPIKFHIDDQQNPSGDQPSSCVLHAGDPNIAPQDWNTPQAGGGNGMPGGRYVVTVRATDVNGSGGYQEWDVPIYLPWWSTRTNSPLRYK